MVATLYCAKIWCKKRKERRMCGLRVALSEVRDAPAQSPQPSAPVLALPPPVQPHPQVTLYPQARSSYARSPQEQLGSQAMPKYNLDIYGFAKLPVLMKTCSEKEPTEIMEHFDVNIFFVDI